MQTMFDGMKNADVAMMKFVMPKAMLEGEAGQKDTTEEEKEAMKRMFEEITFGIGEDGNAGEVKVTMSSQDMEFDVTYHCVKEDGAWKVDMTKGGMGMPGGQ